MGKDGGTNLLLLSMLEPHTAWICADAVHAASLCEYIYESVLLYLENTVSLISPISSYSYVLSVFSSMYIPETSHLGLSVPRSLSPCMLTNCVSVFVPIYCKKFLCL